MERQPTVAAAEQYGGITGEQRWWIRRRKDRKRGLGWHLAVVTTSSEASTAAMVPMATAAGSAMAAVSSDLQQRHRGRTPAVELYGAAAMEQLINE
nr:hypothetical protein Iba_chr12aCG13490 [Ipomoea batatas]GME01452.1 hypothetical protein Iba_scaffold57534CG0010 [Ipomoea batatas]